LDHIEKTTDGVLLLIRKVEHWGDRTWEILDQAGVSDIQALSKSLISVPKSSLFDTVSYAAMGQSLEVASHDQNGKEKMRRLYPVAEAVLTVFAFTRWLKGSSIIPEDEDSPSYRFMIQAAETTLRCFNEEQKILPFKTTSMSLGELIKTIMKCTVSQKV